jgi:hypothetical protein
MKFFTFRNIAFLLLYLLPFAAVRKQVLMEVPTGDRALRCLF